MAAVLSSAACGGGGNFGSQPTPGLDDIWELTGLLAPAETATAQEAEFHTLHATALGYLTDRPLTEKRRRGEPLDDHLPDAMLAGTAVNRGIAIITRNEKDFRNTGARIVNPWAGPHG